jgi:hypothetical protein
MQLGTEFSPGQYVLQVIVTDTLAKQKQQIASQWDRFRNREIVGNQKEQSPEAFAPGDCLQRAAEFSCFESTARLISFTCLSEL